MATPKYVYDAETYPNYFCFVVEELHPEGKGQWWYFEISQYRNDIENIYKFFYKRQMFLFGFNSFAFDNVLLHYLILNYERLSSVSNLQVAAELHRLADILINGQYDDYKQWKYKPNHLLYYDPVDLFRFWTRLIRMSKHVSLKAMQVAIEYHNVQELPIPPNTLIELEQIPDLKWYCKNDTSSTGKLAYRLKEEFNLKRKIREQYYIPNTLVSDDVNIGLEILMKYYLAANPHLERREVIEGRTYYGKIDFNQIILPHIEFKDIGFAKLLAEWRNTTIDERGKFSRKVHFKGKRYDLGLGGLHTKDEPIIFSPADDEYYMACDVRSYYPNLLMSWGWYPKHLGPELLVVYKKIYEQRVEAKLNKDKITDKALKLTLNGFTGMLKNEYSWVLDRAMNMRITVNGQLFLCMLAERFEDAGFKVVSGNTDGLEVLVKKTRYQEYLDICSEWEKIAKVELEHEKYVKMVRRDVNSYLAIYDNGKVKEKGFFRTNPPLEDAHNFLIIPKAIRAHFEKGERIEDFIRNHENFFDFCAFPRMDKKYLVDYGGEILPQRGNRVFISKRGKSLSKVDTETNKRSALYKGDKLSLANKYEENLLDQVDRQAYISKVYEYLSRYTQSSLFN